MRLRTVTAVEAATAVVARRRWRTEIDRRISAMSAADAAWRVRTLSDVLRKASDSLGRSYLRIAAAVWPLTGTDQIPAYGAPLIEEWGQRHERADRRLFRA